MVRSKIKKVLALGLLLITVCSAQASAVSPYDGTISTTYLTVFRDVVSDLGANEDYLFYRSGQYEYTLIAGDLYRYGDTVELFDDGRAYVLTYQSNYGQDNYYHWEVNDISSFSLAVGDYLVYSNLSGYPSLEGRETVYAYSTLFVMCVLCVAFVLRSCFGFVLRRR